VADPHPEDEVVIRWAGVTHPGKVRRNNEDRFLMVACSSEEHHILPKEGMLEVIGGDFILAVSDGMGGASLGEHASAVVLRELGDRIPRAVQVGAAKDREQILSDGIAIVHRKINEEATRYEECSGMGATLSLVWFRGKSMSFAHIGDSRIYLYSGGQLQQITEDHSTVGRMVRMGEITPMMARIHPLRSVLRQAIGAGIRNINPQMGQVDSAAGDVYLLCSDGLTDGVTDTRISNILGKIARNEATSTEARDELLELALEAGGRDNITVVIGQIVD
jgi:PPM family protein phosphatase